MSKNLVSAVAVLIGCLFDKNSNSSNPCSFWVTRSHNRSFSQIRGEERAMVAESLSDVNFITRFEIEMETALLKKKVECIMPAAKKCDT